LKNPISSEQATAAMVFKKVIPRRTFLRGLGTTVALPLLEGMVPPFSSTLAAADTPTRVTFVYFPNGVIMDKWTPATEGTGFEMSTILEPLAPFRDHLLVLSGLDNNPAQALPGIDVTGEHPRASGAFLTGTHVNYRSRDLQAGISVDQVIAQEFQKHTQLASLEVGIESPEILGTCDGMCTYQNTLCWSNPTTPLPMENQPRAVFERLFGDSDSTSAAEQRARIEAKSSIIDTVFQRASRLMTKLSPSDRTKFAEYIDAIRDVERRIQVAEEQSPRELPTLERPAGIPPTFREHIKLLFDLQVLAYQCDLTRVSTLQIGHEQTNQSYPDIGITDPYHPLTHHQGDPDKISKATRVNVFHAEMFAYLLEKLRSTKDGDGSLLDHSMVVYGGGLSDGNLHLCQNLPVVLAGGGSGQIKGGTHIRYSKGTPLMNLYMTLLHKLGIPLEKFGDSTGEITLPSA
jgi:uncharacterized protein DUF1552